MNAQNPLEWPAGWPRTSPRARELSRFERRLSYFDAFLELERELERLRARNPILTTDLRLRLDGAPYASASAPDDPGIAVYFTLRAAPTVFACDRWTSCAHNMRAIARTIEALRGIERWGAATLDRAFSGFAALPAAGESSGPSWWSVLGLDLASPERLTEEDLRAAYRRAAKTAHPDAGGSDEAFRLVKDALRQGLDHVRAAAVGGCS